MSVQTPTGPSVRIQDHAAERWEQRGDDRPLREALALAAPGSYTLPDGTPAYPEAEIFVYAPGTLDKELVFIVRRDTLKTVVPSRGRATASQNLSACPCCDGVHEVVATCGCVWCNEALEQLHRGETE